MRALLLLLVISCGGPAAPVIANQATTTEPTRVVATRFAMKPVDSGSEYMKRVFAEVGTGVGSINGEVDRWSEAGAVYEDYYLVGPDRTALESYVAVLAKRDRTFQVPDDRELGYERTATGAWRSYYLERAAALDGAVIESATKSFDPNTAKPIILVDFTEAGARSLAEVTQRIVGKKLAILVDGTIKSAPIITGTIAGGRASIAMGGTDLAEQEREAEALVEVLRAR